MKDGYTTRKGSQAFEDSFKELTKGAKDTVEGLTGMAKFLTNAAKAYPRTWTTSWPRASRARNRRLGRCCYTRCDGRVRLSGPSHLVVPASWFALEFDTAAKTHARWGSPWVTRVITPGWTWT